MSTPDQPSYRQRLGYHSGLLGLFALLASTTLMMSYQGTKEDIGLRLKEDLKATLSKVVPDQLYNNDISSELVTLDVTTKISNKPVEVYIAKQNEKIVAFSYQVVAPDGYSGSIKIMMGINMRGEILGVRVISHKETPGLGDKIEEKKDDWILGFDGLSLENTKTDDWNVKKDGGRFDQFTGATITPRAVVKAIRRGLEFFHQHKSTIINQYKTRQVTKS